MTKEIKVGITILGAIIIAFLGFRALQDNPLFRTTYNINARFARVDGLSKGNYIYVHGVKVGSVRDLTLLPNDSVDVVLSFTDRNEVPKDSKVYLASMDFLGTMGIVLEPGNGEPLEYGAHIKGDTKPSAIDQVTEKGLEVVDQVKPVMTELQTGLQQFNEVLNEQNREHIQSSLASVEQTAKNFQYILEENRADLQATTEHVSNILSTIDTLTTNRSAELDSVIVNLEAASARADLLLKSMNDLSISLNGVITKINNGEGTIGKMFTDTTLYHNLNNLSFELARMTKQVNDNPKYYFKHVKIRLF